MTGQRLVALAVILACLAVMGIVLALGRPDTDEDRARIRAEWQAANGPGAARPWGSDRGSTPIPWGVVIGALALLGALAFAQSMASDATSSPACDLPVQSECP